MTTDRAAGPLDPIADFGHHHTLVHVLLAIDALGQRVLELGAAAPPAGSALHPADDFTNALVGLAALRSQLRGAP